MKIGKYLISLIFCMVIACASFVIASAGSYTVTQYMGGSFTAPIVTVTNSNGGSITANAFRLTSSVTNVSKISCSLILNSVDSGSSLSMDVYYSTNLTDFAYGARVNLPLNTKVDFTIDFGSSTKTITSIFVIPTAQTWPGYGYAIYTPLFTRTLTDNTAPAITLSQQSYFSNSSVMVTSTITDSESGVSVRKWAQGYQSLSYFTSSGTSFSGSYFYVSANGYYSVYAKDAAGNAAVQYIYVTQMDTTPPTISASASTEYATTNMVTVNITDSQSGVAVRKWAYGSCSVSYFSSSGTTFTGSLFSVSQNGYVTIYARDAAGNETVSYVYVSYIDNAPPTIYAYSSTDYAPTNTVTVTVIDSQSGVSVRKWAYGYNTASYFSYNGNTLSGSSFTAYANGTYTVYAKDVVGNETVTYVIVDHVDNTISVTHSISLNYSLNPDLENPFSADNAFLTNNSRIKVRVSVQSFAAISGGITFTDVSPTYFTNWNHLTAAQTKRYIALGVQVAETTTSSTGWYSINTTLPVYGVNIASPVLLGTLNPNGAQGSLSFSVKCGLAWDGGYTAKHSLTLLFQTE